VIVGVAVLVEVIVGVSVDVQATHDVIVAVGVSCPGVPGLLFLQLCAKYKTRTTNNP
jgi:hypothetical protein